MSCIPADICQAKAYLCDRIDNFINDRILVPMRSIVSSCTQKIRDGDRLMTFGRSSTVLQVFKRAKESVSFHVTVVDSSPKFEGLLSLFIRVF